LEPLPQLEYPHYSVTFEVMDLKLLTTQMDFTKKIRPKNQLDYPAMC